MAFYRVSNGGTLDIVPAGKLLQTANETPSYSDISSYNSPSTCWIGGFNNCIVNCETISTLYYKKQASGETRIYAYYLTDDLIIVNMGLVGSTAWKNTQIPSVARYLLLGIGSTDPRYGDAYYFA